MDAALLDEISKLSGAINRHKANQQSNAPSRGYPGQRRGYAPHRPYRGASYRSNVSATHQAQSAPQEIVINGVTFVSDPSGRKLTRKACTVFSDIAKSRGDPPYPTVVTPTEASNASAGEGDTLTPRRTSIRGTDFIRTKSGNLVSVDRLRTRPPPPADLEEKRARLNNLSLLLNNVQAHRNGYRQSHASKRSVEKKPCRYFTRTGICARGRTCPYVHDPDKVAVCPRFLKNDCPNGHSCPLSHDPTPERMPFCVHFANAGRCKNGTDCIYPHVHLGASAGVCRDFAVLGYCEKGADCDKRHVRECPDFAEHGVCSDRSCKLPHVIRANHAGRQMAQAGTSQAATPPGNLPTGKRKATEDDSTPLDQGNKRRKVEEGTASFAAEPEFISLTFEESDDQESADEESVNSDEVDTDDMDDGELKAYE